MVFVTRFAVSLTFHDEKKKKKKKWEIPPSILLQLPRRIVLTRPSSRVHPPVSICINIFFFYFSRNNRYFVVGRGPLNQARLSVLTFRQTEGLKTTLVNFCQFSLKSNKKLIISRYSYFCEIFVRTMNNLRYSNRAC